MKKVLYAIGIILVVILVWSLYDAFFKNEAVDASALVSDVPEDVFKEYNIGENKVILQGFFNYGDNYLNEERTANLLDQIAVRLGIDSVYKYDRTQEDGKYIATLTKEAKDATVKIKVTTIEIEEAENVISQNSYIEMEMTINNSIESGLYYREKMAEVMKSFCMKDCNDKIYMSIMGEIDGEMDIEKQKELANKYIEKMNGKLVLDTENDGFYSLYAFSDEIKEYVAIGRARVNINIVFSYDDIRDKTIIHIGSPIVNYDY